MQGLRIVVAVLALAGAAAVAQDEVPFITTPDQVTQAMLGLAQVRASDHVIDLGSGDGRIVIAAARHFGASGLGVEIVADLVARSRENARAAGVHGLVEFREQDLFATDLTRATVVTMYLLPEVNLQLRPRLLALAAGTRIVSHDWDLGDWVPDRSLTVAAPEKVVGREKSSRVHLWVVPAAVQGLWCSAEGKLAITQRFQHFSAVLSGPASQTPTRVFDGRIDGQTLHAQGQPGFTLKLQGLALRVGQVVGAGAGFSGREFLRASDGRCP